MSFPPVLLQKRLLVAVLSNVLIGGGGSIAVESDRAVESDPVEEQVPEKAAEYRIKAAFLYNFIRYSTWPKECFDDREAPIILAIVGPDPFGRILDDTLKDKLVDGRRVIVQRSKQLPGKLEAHIVFTVASSEIRQALFAAAKAHPILIVGEDESITSSGGHIRFFLDKGRVRFEVNVKAVKESKLIISSELLKLARIIGKRNPR